MNDIRDTSYSLLFFYVGIIMHHGIKFETALDSLHNKIMNADYENDLRETQEAADKAAEYIENVLFSLT